MWCTIKFTGSCTVVIRLGYQVLYQKGITKLTFVQLEYTMWQLPIFSYDLMNTLLSYCWQWFYWKLETKLYKHILCGYMSYHTHSLVSFQWSGLFNQRTLCPDSKLPTDSKMVPLQGKRSGFCAICAKWVRNGANQGSSTSSQGSCLVRNVMTMPTHLLLSHLFY